MLARKGDPSANTSLLKINLTSALATLINNQNEKAYIDNPIVIKITCDNENKLTGCPCDE